MFNFCRRHFALRTSKGFFFCLKHLTFKMNSFYELAESLSEIFMSNLKTNCEKDTVHFVFHIF